MSVRNSALRLLQREKPISWEVFTVGVRVAQEGQRGTEYSLTGSPLTRKSARRVSFLGKKGGTAELFALLEGKSSYCCCSKTFIRFERSLGYVGCEEFNRIIFSL